MAPGIPPRRASAGHRAVKPQWMLTREVKPPRRSPTTNPSPPFLRVGLTYRTAGCGPACPGGVAGQGGRPLPLCRFREVEAIPERCYLVAGLACVRQALPQRDLK